jgi:hypothetical protein
LTAEAVLARMLEEFDGGRRWTRGYPLRDAHGRFVSPYDWDEETRCCLMGMFCYVRDGLLLPFNEETERETLDRLRRVTGTWNLAHWNDQHRSFGPIAAALRAAIEGGK